MVYLGPRSEATAHQRGPGMATGVAPSCGHRSEGCVDVGRSGKSGKERGMLDLCCLSPVLLLTPAHEMVPPTLRVGLPPQLRLSQDPKDLPH